MRALRVVGLGIEGRTVILEPVPQRSGERRERFTLPLDEGLHAAVRGDLPRLGQIEIELESQMRPREIQARIRAGASVDQVASAAGVPAERVERFAYPVLLERSRTAGLAQQAHPVRSDGPDVRTLDEVVTDTFVRRGHDYEAVNWDSWRGENGRWVVQLRWRAGRSDNRAHWTFHPGAHGGTVTAIDDHAVDLIDPEAGKPLRTVAPVSPLAGQVLTEQTGMEVPAAADSESEQGAEGPVVQEPPAALAVPDDAPGYRTPRPPERSEHSEPSEPTERSGASEPADERHRQEPAAAEKPAEAPKRGRKNHPIVPSWEDVLLGVRSPRN
ncbi:MAG: DUF3071 domain-containing protein [Pseudonocardiaceae bacterium]|nr:DUF3071 domain-containing protein [Pseudonocardiaceae bacterium]